MRPFLERLKSRKLWMAVAAALIAGLKIYYPDIPGDAIELIVKACLGFVAAEAAVDAVGQLAKWLIEKNAKKEDDADGGISKT